MKKNYVITCKGICGQNVAAIVREIAKRRGSFVKAEAWPLRWTESWTGARHAFSWNKLYAVHVTEEPEKLLNIAWKAAKKHGDDEAAFMLADILYTTEEKFKEAIKTAKTEKVEE